MLQGNSHKLREETGASSLGASASASAKESALEYAMGQQSLQLNRLEQCAAHLNDRLLIMLHQSQAQETSGSDRPSSSSPHIAAIDTNTDRIEAVSNFITDLLQRLPT